MNELPVLAVCLPGEQFSSRWVRKWTNLLPYLMNAFGVVPVFEFSSNIYHTRNSMAQFVLALPQVDYILWIDDDNLMDAEQFTKLWDDLQSHPEAAMVAAWAWCENGQFPSGAKISAGRIREDGTCEPFHPNEILDRNKLLEAGYTGFPAVLMLADTLRKAGKNPFTPIMDSALEFGYSGEDYAFCTRVKGKIYVDPECQVPHLKFRAIQPTRLLKTKECAA